MRLNLYVILTLINAVVFPLLIVRRYSRYSATTKLRDLLSLLTLLLMIFGGEGFFLFGLVTANIIKLPDSFEWPAGHVGGVARTLEGHFVVPLQFPARVQLYDSNLRFVRGWHVETGGESFTVASSAEGTIDIYRGLGQIRDSYTEAGDFVSTENIYMPDFLLRSRSTDRPSGEMISVPTPLWRVLIFNPFFIWLVAVFGVAGRFFLGRESKLPHRYASRCGHEGNRI